MTPARIFGNKAADLPANSGDSIEDQILDGFCGRPSVSVSIGVTQKILMLETVFPHRHEGLFQGQLQRGLLCDHRFPEESNLVPTGQYPGSKPDCGYQRSGYRTSELADHDHGLDVPARKIATRLAEADNGWAKEVA